MAGRSLDILFLSDFYPPLRAGGYSQLCEDVALRLRQRGHRLFVLTSNYLSRHAPVLEEDVSRSLHLEGDLHYYRPVQFLLHWKQHQSENELALNRTLRDIRPDVVLIWSLRGLSKSIAAIMERKLPNRVAYYLAGHWPVVEDMHAAYWFSPSKHRVTRGLKRWGGSIAKKILNNNGQNTPEFKHVMCVSAGLRDSLIKKGLQLENARVVYNGIDVNQFSPERGLLSPLEKRENLRLLVAGQIARHKGVHTAIEAMNQLVHEDGIKNVQLTIVGTGHPDYLAHLRQLTTREKLDGFVEFRDWVPRDKMPALLRNFDVLLLTSIYDEPMARIAQEAMASGLVLIGTRTGGTKELLRDGENGLAFTPGDSQELAAQIRILFRDRELAKHLRVAGMKTIDQCFNIERMVDEIETYLFSLAGQSEWLLKGGPIS